MPYMPFAPSADTASLNPSDVAGWEDYDVFMAKPPTTQVTQAAPAPQAVPLTFPYVVQMYRAYQGTGRPAGAVTIIGTGGFLTQGYDYWDYENEIWGAPDSTYWPDIRTRYAQIYSGQQGRQDDLSTVTTKLRTFTTNMTTWLAT